MQRRKKIELYLEKNPGATERDIQKKFGLSFREAQGFLQHEDEGVGSNISLLSRINGWFASEWRTILTLFGVALLVRVGYIGFLFRDPLLRTPLHDALSYLTWAQDILSDGWLGGKIFFTEPLYAYLLACFLKLFGVYGDEVLIGFQMLFGAFFPVTIFWLGKRVFNREVGILAGLIAAIYGPLIFYDGLLLKTSLEVYFLPFFLLLVYRVFELPTWKGFGWIGISLGVLSLIKGNNLIFWPTLLGLLWWLFRLESRQLKLLWSLALSGGLLLILSPVTLRNFVVGHDFVPTNYSIGLVLYQGSWWGGDGSTANVPRFLRPDPRYEEQDAVGMAEAYVRHSLRPSEVSRFWMKKTFEEIVAFPGHFIATLWNKFLLVLNQSEFSDNYSYTFYRSHIPFLWVLPTYALVVVLALFGFGVMIRTSFWEQFSEGGEKKILKKRFIFFALFGAYLSVLLLTTVNARYRMPLLPFFFLMASGAVTFFLSCLVERERHVLARSSLFLIPLLVAVWFPLASLKHVTTDANAYHALGYQALLERDYPKAKELFEKTLELDPQYGWAYGNLALTSLALGDLAAAKTNLKQLILLRPDDISNYDRLKLIRSLEGMTPDVMKAAAENFLDEKNTPEYDADFNEAQRFLSSGDTDRAEKLLEQSVAQSRDRSASLIALASLKKQKKELAQARELLKRVVAEHPENFTARYNLANIYIDEKNYNEIVRLLKDIYDFTPELGETWYNYIVALTKTGQNNLAATAAEAYVDHYANDPIKKEKVEQFKAALKPSNSSLDTLIQQAK